MGGGGGGGISKLHLVSTVVIELEVQLWEEVKRQAPQELERLCTGGCGKVSERGLHQQRLCSSFSCWSSRQRDVCDTGNSND